MKFIFHVIATDLSQDDRDRLNRLADENALDIRRHDADEKQFLNIPYPSHLTRAVYNRFLICSVLAGVASKVLYLDADIICLGSVEGLASLDMRGNVAAVAEDIKQDQARTAIGLTDDHPYFNSGVMYIDVNRWNELGVTEALVNILGERGNVFPLPDQDALNIELLDKVLFLDRRWNLFIDVFPITADAVFLHYNGQKPWQLWSNNYRDQRFTSALGRTPWAAWKFVPKSRKHRNRYAKHLLGKGRVVAGLYWYSRFMLTAKTSGQIRQ